MIRDRPATCPMCGAPSVRAGRARTMIAFDVPKLGRGTTVAELPVVSCRRCVFDAEGDGSARAGRGWSRRELAERTGIGTASIFRWETGRVFQSRSNDRLLRLALGLPMPASARRGSRGGRAA
jgi:hypothetical protein